MEAAKKIYLPQVLKTSFVQGDFYVNVKREREEGPGPQKHYNTKWKRTVYEIRAGQYWATSEKKAVLSTLLGSCVAVCLRDPVQKVSGMNHFMLPGDLRRRGIIDSPNAKYGIHAMELLINAVMKKGGARANLEAKVFGGGQVLNSSFVRISQSNVDFARAFLKMEDIPIISEDTSGSYGRKIYYFVDTGDIYLRRIPQKKAKDRFQRDQNYLDRLKSRKHGDEDSNLTLF